MILPNPVNDRRLLGLKDVHKGRRAFLLGNGPSLRVADLERLKGEVSFASNKIFLAFDQTDWRPTYLTVCDVLVAENNRERLAALDDATRVFGSSVAKTFENRAEDIAFVNPPTPEGEAEWNPVKGFRSGHSVVNLDIKLAYWMGCDPLYVIGLDFHFEIPDTPTGEVRHGNQVIVSQGERNHFHSEYRAQGETWTVPKLDCQTEEFLRARRFLESRGRRICNASRSTRLEAWPRVDFDALLA